LGAVPNVPRVSAGVAMRRTATMARPLSPLVTAAAIPTLIQMIVWGIFTAFGWPQLVLGTFAGTFSALFVIVPSITVGGGVIAGLAATQAGAAAAARVSAAASGKPLKLGEALRQTSSVFIRALPVWLLYGAIQWSTVALLGWWLEGVRRSALSNPNAAQEAGVQLVLLLLASLALIPITIFFQVKFFLFIPAITFERLEGLSALRRSWQLTRGVAGPIVAALSLAGGVTSIAGGMLMPFVAANLPDSDAYTADLASPSYGVAAALAALIPAIMLITTPLLWVFSTVLYRFQMGVELAPPPAFLTRYPQPYGYPVVVPPPGYGYPPRQPPPPIGGYPPPPPGPLGPPGPPRR